MCSYIEFIIRCRHCQTVIRQFKTDWEFCPRRGRCVYLCRHQKTTLSICSRCQNVRCGEVACLAQDNRAGEAGEERSVLPAFVEP
ncbi:hypothetical protein BX600DRAFT_477001 [Xylariales sp. PMI_506]|nr:hypothetical protein BX600DRAFT_477001 [Xylariales sp. PMI_506]